VIYVVVMAAVQATFQVLQGIYAPVMDYKVDILLTLFFG
jgi:hypothetical protein